jgi:Glycosyl hydrolase family 9
MCKRFLTVQMASASLVSVAIIVASLLAAAFSALAIVYNDKTAGYTYVERITADPWDSAVVFWAIFTIIPPVVLLANAFLPRKAIAALVHNRGSAAALLKISLLALLATPALHVFANFTMYSNFTAALNVAPVPAAPLGAAATRYLELMRTGPAPAQPPLAPGAAARGAADVGLTNPRTGGDLSGGWVTGPGNAKVTIPIAAAMCDLAFTMLAFRPELAELGIVSDVRDQLVHGAQYLQAAYDSTGNGSLVSHVYDGSLSDGGSPWRRVEQVAVGERVVEFVEGLGPGTDIYAIGARLILVPVCAAMWLPAARARHGACRGLGARRLRDRCTASCLFAMWMLAVQARRHIR